jgi:hypothetical protein
MAKLNLEQIGKAAGALNSAAPGWMERLQEIVGTVKETAKIVKEVRQLEAGGGSTGAMQNAGGGWGKFLATLIEKGYGDKPIGEIITELAPYTIKQLIHLAGVAGGKNETGNKE